MMRSEVIQRPPMPFEAVVNWNLSEELFLLAEKDGFCKNCGGVFVDFEDEFYMDAGYGFNWIVSGKSGLCINCFEKMKSTASPSKSVPPASRRLYSERDGSRDLITIEDVI